MSHRPRRTGKDTNHNVVSKAAAAYGNNYHGLPLRLHDTADLPSSSGFLDWLVFIGPIGIMIEVKTWEKHRRFTDGERETLTSCYSIIPVEVVTSIEDVLDVFEKYAPMAYQIIGNLGLLCETKPDWLEWLGE